MREFTDEQGRAWIAEAFEEETPRHHGRWHLVFHPPGESTPLFPAPEVRWQTRESAVRTLDTMSLFELRRRLAALRRRAPALAPDGAAAIPWVDRTITTG
jgi:hypothetical protein